MKPTGAMQRWLNGLLATGLTLLAASLTAQETAVQPAGDAQAAFDVAPHLESFDVVWNTIKKTHWDKSLVGEAWDAAREEFRPQVESARSAAEARAAINGLLESLKQSHFAIIARQTYDEMNEAQGGGGEGTVGLEIRLVDEKLLVTRVAAGLPGEAAGVQPGWIVKLVDTRTADEIIRAARQVSEHSVMRVDTATGLICDARTTGDIGDPLPMAFIDHKGKTRLESLELVAGPGQPETFGNLPTFHVDFKSDRLEGDVGYIRFNAFIGGPRLIREYNQAMQDYHDSNGLVIDLRGNRGGMLILVAGMCGWLVDSRDPIGTMTISGGNQLRIVMNPRKPMFDKPVAVLTDECSISAAEIMAGGIKDLKIGRIFGGTTAGLSLPSVVSRLPNGDGFQYAISSYESASGESIEGTGVIPDEEIRLTRKMLSDTADPVLSAAKKWILEQGEHDN